MKCEHCGGNISIENKFCPNCAQPNIHYVQHREDMDRYNEDYKETRKEILDKTKWYNKMAVAVTIIAVLVALDVALLYAYRVDGRITKNIIINRNEKHVEEYSQIIDNLIEERDYCELTYFMDSKMMPYPSSESSFSQYTAVCRMAESYESIYNSTMKLYAGKYPNGVDGYAQNVADMMKNAYKVATLPEYMTDEEKAKRTPEKQAFIDDCIADCEDLIRAQAGLSDEDMAEFRNASNARMAIMIEEGIYNYGK